MSHFTLGMKQSLINLGNFDAVIHGHKRDLSIGISVSWKLPEQIDIAEVFTDSLSFSTTVVTKNRLDGFCYTVGEHDFEIRHESRGYAFRSPYRPHHSPVVYPFRCYGICSRPSGPTEKFFGFDEAFENLFSRILYLGPLREYPRRRYLGKATIQKVSDSMEKRQLPPCSPGAFDTFLLTSRYQNGYNGWN